MAHFNLSIAYEITQNLEHALQHLKKAIELDPWHAKAHYALARLLHIKNQHKPGLPLCTKATYIDPYFFEAYYLLGNIYKALNNVPQAIQAYSNALQLKPHHKDLVNTLYNLAYTLKNTDHIDEAITCYQKVLKCEPQHAHAHLGIAQCYLIQGKLNKGFEEFEWRAPEIKKFKHYDWKNADLTGKTILVRCEWGFGDCIQFIRYLKLIKNQGARVILQLYKPLVDLFALCPYIDKIVQSGHIFPKHDIQIPLLSLPHIFGTTLETIPTEVPYIFADRQLIGHWQKKLPTKKINIGICWCGSGDHKALPSLNKNIQLATFDPLAQLQNIQLYSLQKIHGYKELQNCTFNLHIFDETFDRDNGRFMDTAAIMKNLDLIITIDTSIAHLAGALGVPVWVLLPYKADWRWMLNKTNSPWYPTMRLFRQKKPGDWETVIQEIIKELS